ncbi:Integrase core domain-containing protein [Donghicola eburneus]|nr:Integrase core domain-containing protein [Donghicola eburneus]
MLSDNGGAHTAKETRIFAQQLGLKSCFTPVKSPQYKGMSEALVKNLKRDSVRVNPLPDAKTVLSLIGEWTEDLTKITHTAA